MPLTPAQVEKVRARILAEPRGRNPEACCFLAEHVLGYRVTWYFRIWVAWTLTYVRTILLAKRGLGKSYCAQAVDIYRILCDFNTRMTTISLTAEAAEQLNAPVRAVLEENEILKQVFGSFVGRARWKDASFIVAQRTNHMIPEGTLDARGIETQVARTHYAHARLDDAQDQDRAKSELLTERDFRWLFETLRGALLDRSTIHIYATPATYMDLVTRLEDLADPRTGEVRAEAWQIDQARDYLAEYGRLPPASTRWMILRTPAILTDGSSIDPERAPLEDQELEDGFVIEGLNSLVGTPGFAQQQMVEKPAKPDTTAKGTVFRREWLLPWTHAPERKDLRVFQYIDPAWLSAMIAAARRRGQRDPDWFVIATIARHRRSRLFYVMDLVRRRCTPLERFTLAREAVDLWDPEIVGCERTNLQVTMPGAREFYEGLRKLIGARIRFDHVNTRGGKVARAEPFALACQQQEVLWNPELLARPELTDPERGELVVFPFGEDLDPIVHDDQVDGLSGAYSYARRRTGDLRAFVRHGEAQAGAAEADPDSSARAVQARGSAPRKSLRGFGDPFGDSGADGSARCVPR